MNEFHRRLAICIGEIVSRLLYLQEEIFRLGFENATADLPVEKEPGKPAQEATR